MNDIDKILINQQNEELKKNYNKKEYIEQEVFKNFNVNYPKKVEFYSSHKADNPIDNYILNLEKEALQKEINHNCLIVENLLKKHNISYNSNLKENTNFKTPEDVIIADLEKEDIENFVNTNQFELEKKYALLINLIKEQNKTL